MNDGLDGFRSRIYAAYRGAGRGGGAPDADAPRVPYLERLVEVHFPSDRGSVVLDLGCGRGELVRVLREAGYRDVVGVDSSPSQVGSAPSGVVVHDDLFEHLSGVGDGSVDVLVSFDVVEHLTKPELLRLADEARRVLRRGGRWIVHAPNAAGLFGGMIRFADLTHEQAFTRESLGQLFGAAGFDDASFFEDRPVVHGVVSALRYLAWMALRLGFRILYAVETGSTGEECIFSKCLLAVAVRW